MTPPKPAARPRQASLLRHLRLFRRDILSAQPEHLYSARMAEFRTPFFRSYLINEPVLIREVLVARPEDFPKSDRVAEGLRPLLGNSVFLTNGEVWKAQRRIIDPAFKGGRLRDTYPGMLAAVQAGVDRLRAGQVDIEPEMSHIAADVIFRTLFSVPIEDQLARTVFEAFQTYQRSAPILNLAAFVPLPRWIPRPLRRQVRANARVIRQLIARMVERRADEIAEGTAPDDLATKIMTTPDPETGKCLSPADMVDQVAIFFLAGHETSASAVSWALYLLATHPSAQARAVEEAMAFAADPSMSTLKGLTFTRDVFRETLRLYPPVPMMVREVTKTERFRNRPISRGAQIVVSPWHLQRSTRLWEAPDDFDPDRWSREGGTACPREAYVPFSTGSRICPGAGFAMLEGPLMLATILARWSVAPVDGRVPIPVAHLTVRGENGIWLDFNPRSDSQ